jgi:hypothetical protein
MADQGDSVQVAVMQKAHDVGDMALQPDLRTEQMGALAKARQCRANHRMIAGLERRRDVAPTPAAEPRAGNEEEHGHPGLLARRAECTDGLSSAQCVTVRADGRLPFTDGT